MVNEYCFQEIPRERRFLFLLALQPACESLFLRVGTIGFKIEDSESLPDGVFHVGRETALPADFRCGSIQVRNIVRPIEQSFKGICRELLSEPRAVIHLPVLVVDESSTVNAAFIISRNTTSIPCLLSRRMKSSRLPRQPCMASATPFRILGCHFLSLYSRALNPIRFSSPS